jgi:carbonic anhydrase
MSNKQYGLVDNWLRNIKDVHFNNKSLVESVESKKQEDLLVELNVKQQVRNISATSIVQNAWDKGRPLKIHGLVYSLETGLLKDLNSDIKGKQDLSRDQIYDKHE